MEQDTTPLELRALVIIDHKHLNQSIELIGLVLGLLYGRVGFLDKGRIVLGHFIDLAH
jgi:hypothetical protein